MFVCLLLGFLLFFFGGGCLRVEKWFCDSLLKNEKEIIHSLFQFLYF